MPDSAQPHPDVIANPEFLKRAEICIGHANAASTDAEREAWLEVAESWLRLALPKRSQQQRQFQDELNAKHTGQKNSDAVN
jgi:hypothetical protein